MRGSEPKLEGGTFSPALIPSPAMICHLQSQPRLLRRQSLEWCTPKPCSSNLAHFITPAIRPLLPHRTTWFCSSQIDEVYVSKAVLLRQQRPTCFYLMSEGTSTVSGLSWHQQHEGSGNGGTGICWGRSCRMRDIHTNAVQM